MKRIVTPIILALVFAAGGAAFLIYARIQEPYRGFAGDEQFVEIAQGAGSRAIGDQLVAAGVVRDALTFRAALWLSGDARRLQAGEYRFDRAMPAGEVVGKIARGEIDAVPVTMPEGLTLAEMSRVFAGYGLGSAADFMAAARDVSLVAPFDPAARDLEGYLFPDTYPVPHRASAPRLVRLMVQQFGRTATDALRTEAKSRGLTPRQWVTLASLVEKESARPDERPVIAAVYENRLKLGMALQCDPTVIYALAQAGTYTGNLRRDDLQLDSPYNTYRYPGLPPGPIAAPGRASLEAVARPANVPYLYFVSRNDGSHAFAQTLEEHNRNVRKFQVEYFRAGGAGR